MPAKLTRLCQVLKVITCFHKKKKNAGVSLKLLAAPIRGKKAKKPNLYFLVLTASASQKEDRTQSVHSQPAKAAELGEHPLSTPMVPSIKCGLEWHSWKKRI